MNQPIPRPAFHLQRVNDDGSSEAPVVYSLNDLPSDFGTSRRGLLRTGVAAVGLLALMDQAAESADNVPLKPVARPPGNRLLAHAGPVAALAFSPDGKLLVSGGGDRTIKIWTMPQGVLDREVIANARGVLELRISPDGKWLASGSIDKTIFLWRLPSEDPQKEKPLFEIRSLSADRTIRTDNGSAALAFLPDSESLASGSMGEAIQIWSVSDSKLQRTIRQAAYSPVKFAVTPDGAKLAASSRNGTLKLFSLPKGEVLKTSNVGAGLFGDMAITADGTTLVTCGASGKVRIWSLPELTLTTTQSIGTALIEVIAIAPNSELLAAGLNQGNIQLLALPSGERHELFQGDFSAVHALAISPDGRLLASGHHSGAIMLWDLVEKTSRGYLFDRKINSTDGNTYNVKSASGQTLSYTMPCGSPLPAGATCTCNCVPGTFVPPVVLRPVPLPPTRFGGSICTCVPVCTCVPICQAHRLLHRDPVVQTMAEELLLVMGDREFEYMHWAAQRAEPALQQRVEQTITAIQVGARPNPSRWPTLGECSARLNDSDEVVCVMAAQMIDLQRTRADWSLDATRRQRVSELLADARRRPWHVRATSGR